MKRVKVATGLFALLLLLPATATAQTALAVAPPSPIQPATRIPVELGVFGSFRAGRYLFGGVGGHIRLRVHPRLWLEMFSDNLAGVQDGGFRHDHEIGGRVQVPFAIGSRVEIFPMLGVCVSLIAVHSPFDLSKAATDVGFGGRAGAGATVRLSDHFVFEWTAEGLVYAAHTLAYQYDWTQRMPSFGSTVTAQPAFHTTVAVDYRF